MTSRAKNTVKVCLKVSALKPTNSTSRMQRSGPLRRTACQFARQSMGTRGGVGRDADRSGVRARFSITASGNTISIIVLSDDSTSADLAPVCPSTMAGTSVETISPPVEKNCLTDEIWVRSS